MQIQKFDHVKFGKWISVDDKSPETDDVYLVYLGESEKKNNRLLF